MNGTIQEIGNGYWFKVDAIRVLPSSKNPHGINDSLTLHEPSGKRVFGIDNAHPVTKKKGPGRKRAKLFDHVHREKRILMYEYESAEALLRDFF